MLSEADPQGSLVATATRDTSTRSCEELLGEDAIVLRTISGDLTSNGTVAERDFVEGRDDASGDIPTVVVKGDHDTAHHGRPARASRRHRPDLEVAEVGGIAVAGAADPAFKALFGGLVQNPCGVTEPELGEALREVVDDHDGDATGIDVLLHQPRAAAALPRHRDHGRPRRHGRATRPRRTTTGSPTSLRAWSTSVTSTTPRVRGSSGTPTATQVTWTVVSQLGTSGGVEENPTFNRFSTPFSVPLKDISVRLAYLNPDTGLQTGYASVVISPTGNVTVEDRVDVGLPGGRPGDID